MLSFVLYLDPGWVFQLCSFCFRDLLAYVQISLWLRAISFQLLATFPADSGSWVPFRTSPPVAAWGKPERCGQFSHRPYLTFPDFLLQDLRSLQKDSFQKDYGR